MKTTVTRYDVHNMFKEIRPDNFTYHGLNLLIDEIEQLEEDLNEDIEIDVIAFCCDYTEYENFKEIKENYTDIETIEDLQEETTVLYDYLKYYKNFSKVCNNASCNHNGHKIEDLEDFPIVIRNF